jgi:hypothetical protein
MRAGRCFTSSVFNWEKAVFVAGLCLLLSGCHMRGADVGPAIEFSRIPPADEGGPEKMDTISGRVIGASPGQQLVLYARSGQWWVQPLAVEPFTKIQPDTSWSATIHMGTEYAALLVGPGYHPSATLKVLPARGGDVISVAVVNGTKSRPMVSKIVHFSGYDWKARVIGSTRGGRPNAYDPANAWTDDKGALHLRIAKRPDGNWTSAEVALTRSFGYGTYVFVVRDASRLEPAAALSLFTWDESDPSQNHREVDVELSRWGIPANKNAQYVVQPYYISENVARFMAPPGVVTHSFQWGPGRASFRSVRGTSAHAGSGNVAEHLFTSGVPSPGAERVHLNLCVAGGVVVPLQNEAEVVIEKFEYFP